MKTFREYFKERYDFPQGGAYTGEEYLTALSETFFQYVDEIVAPAAAMAANPPMFLAQGPDFERIAERYKPGAIIPVDPETLRPFEDE